MKQLLVGIVAFGAAALSAEAGVICASPQEMKVLQSAALQQQLMVAALTCNKSADYNQFVTSFRGQLIKSDNELKAFFAGRPRGEDYNAYKTRVANAASLRSLRDTRFCDSAQKVFDLALGRGEEHRGLAPEPPQLIDTGYEGCRPVDDRLITVQAVPKPEPKPVVKPAETRVAGLQLAKPPVVPEPKPVLDPVDQQALAFVPKAAPTTRVGVTALPVLASAHAPKLAVPAAKSSPLPKLVTKVAALPPARLMPAPPVRVAQASAAPAAMAPPPAAIRETPSRMARDMDEPARMTGQQSPRYTVQEPERYADEEPPHDADQPPRYASEQSPRYVNEPSPRYAGEPSPRYASEQSPRYVNEPSPRYASEQSSRYANAPSQRDSDEDPQDYTDDQPQRYADEAPQGYAGQPQRYNGPPQGYAGPAQRTATAERPQWQRGDRSAYRQDRDNDDDLSTDDSVPYAYRPGSTWVDNARPVPAAYGPPPPRWAPPHRRSYLVRAPDGRWIVVIGRQSRWVRD